MPPKPFSFGVTCDLPTGGDEWRALCRSVEDAGFSALLASDHFGDQLALIPALAAAVEATSTVRVGALVACNDYRHPVMYAKELATLDVLAGGRIDWGIGAGWLREEYARVGLAFDEGRVRADRLFEAVAVMKGCFADAPLTFGGTHYRIDAYDGRPKPLQRPHPRLLVAGSGRRVLSFAAAEADIVGIAPSLLSRRIGDAAPQCSVEAAVDRQLEWIRAAAGAVVRGAHPQHGRLPRDRHRRRRRGRGTRRAGGRLLARRGPPVAAHLDRHGRRDLRVARSARAHVGASPTGRSRPGRCTRCSRWSSDSPVAEPRHAPPVRSAAAVETRDGPMSNDTIRRTPAGRSTACRS